MKGYWKLCQKMMTFLCVPFCLRSHGCFERCIRNEMTTSKYCWTWTSFYMHGSKKVLKHSCVLNVGSFDTLSIRRCWSSWRKWRMIRIERWGHLTSERTTWQSWQNHQRLFRNLYRRDTVSLLPFLQVFDMITTCRTNSIQTARTFGIGAVHK